MTLVPSLGENDTLTTLSSLAARLLRTTYAQVSLVTGAHYSAAATGQPPAYVQADHPRDESMCTIITRTARLLSVSDARNDPRVAHLPSVAEGAVRAYLGVPLVDTDGHVVGALGAYDESPRSWSQEDVTVLEDLGQAVVAELERLALSAENQTARLRLDLAMEAAGLGSWDWDVTTGVLTWDDRLRVMFGYGSGESEDFDSTVHGFARRLHADDRQGVRQGLRRTVESGADYEESYRVVLPSGALRWVTSRGRPLRDPSGAVVRVVGAAVDVTEQHLAELERSTAVSLLELVARASRVLATSLETEHAVRGLARLMVPALADWSIVTLVGADGLLHDVESWHRDPELRPAVATLAVHRLQGLSGTGTLGEALETRRPVFVTSGGAARAEDIMRSKEALGAVRELRHESLAVFPLLASGEVVGMLTLARGGQRPALGREEVATAAEIADRAGTALEHARSFGQVRHISEVLQRTMLTDPATPEGVQIEVLYTPAAHAAQVGGDWYDSFVQPDGSTMLVVGDVIGHDSEAAATMGQLRSLTRGISYSSDASPAEVLTRVDHAMDGLDVDTIATAVVARLHRDATSGAGRLQWSNAGHPPVVVLGPDGSTVLLEGHDLLLGISRDPGRFDQEMDLAPGSVVLLYTDGLVERRGEDITDGFERLRSVMYDGRRLPLADLVTHVHRAMVTEDPDDDIAMLALSLAERLP